MAETDPKERAERPNAQLMARVECPECHYSWLEPTAPANVPTSGFAIERLCGRCARKESEDR